MSGSQAVGLSGEEEDNDNGEEGKGVKEEEEGEAFEVSAATNCRPVIVANTHWRRKICILAAELDKGERGHSDSSQSMFFLRSSLQSGRRLDSLSPKGRRNTPGSCWEF